MDLYCKKCLSSRTGDMIGGKCQREGCEGVIEERPLFSTLVDSLPEPMTCGRRLDGFEGQDHWQKFKSNGNRVCSYCGSLHPDDMFELVRQCAEAPEDAPHNSVVEIEPSSKRYKIYVHQPGVRNAMEGGIKFYTHHIPHDEDGKMVVSDERNAEFKKAVRVSQARFGKRMQEMYPKKV